MRVHYNVFKLRSLLYLEIFYVKVKFGHLGICMKKNGNYLFFKNTIATCDLKVGRWIELDDVMKLHEYHRSRSRSFFDLR